MRLNLIQRPQIAAWLSLEKCEQMTLFIRARNAEKRPKMSN